MIKSIGILVIAAVILWIEVPPLLEKNIKKSYLYFQFFLQLG